LREYKLYGDISTDVANYTIVVNVILTPASCPTLLFKIIMYFMQKQAI